MILLKCQEIHMFGVPWPLIGCSLVIVELQVEMCAILLRGLPISCFDSDDWKVVQDDNEASTSPITLPKLFFMFQLHMMMVEQRHLFNVIASELPLFMSAK